MKVAASQSPGIARGKEASQLKAGQAKPGLRRCHGICPWGATRIWTGFFLILACLSLAGCVGNPAPTILVSGLDNPYGIARDPAGNLYVAERKLGTVVKITPSGVKSACPGGPFKNPMGVAVDGSGNLYVCDTDRGFVKKITPDGIVSAAGKGLGHPRDLCLDAAGNLYVVDQKYLMVYRITPGGVKTSLAGDGQKGFRDGAAAQAEFGKPHGIAVDAQGQNVYVGDTGNGRVRKISGGMVSTLAGGLGKPQDLAVDGWGNVYVSDVRQGLKKITPAGEVSLVTGLCRSPRGLALGPGGALYVVDNGSSHGTNTILKIQLPK